MNKKKKQKKIYQGILIGVILWILVSISLLTNRNGDNKNNILKNISMESIK